MEASEILREKGVKKSAQRIAIINTLRKFGVPVTETDIKKEMGDMYDRITFYRTIQTLLDADIIHKINIDNQTIKYALNQSQGKGHIHFYCKKCGSVTCFNDIHPDDYNLPSHFKQEECEVIIKGICASCQEK